MSERVDFQLLPVGEETSYQVFRKLTKDERVLDRAINVEEWHFDEQIINDLHFFIDDKTKGQLEFYPVPRPELGVVEIAIAVSLPEASTVVYEALDEALQDFDLAQSEPSRESRLTYQLELL